MLVPKGRHAQNNDTPKVKGANEGAGPAAAPSAAPVAPSRRVTRPVTPADLLVRHDTPMVPISESTQKGTRWRFRHPDADGSEYTGPVHLAALNRYLSAEEGYVVTDRPEERAALKAMGWILWGTEVPDARPFGSARAF